MFNFETLKKVLMKKIFLSFIIMALFIAGTASRNPVQAEKKIDKAGIVDKLVLTSVSEVALSGNQNSLTPSLTIASEAEFYSSMIKRNATVQQIAMIQTQMLTQENSQPAVTICQNALSPMSVLSNHLSQLPGSIAMLKKPTFSSITMNRTALSAATMLNSSNAT
jgi:hypothetical protein